MMIDSHLHLQSPVFRECRDEIIAQLRKLGVGILVVNATRPADWDELAELAMNVPEVIPFFGVHPWYVDDLPNGWLRRLDSLLSKFPKAGVGEIGLDKWIRGHNVTRQREVLDAQLALAEAHGRSVTLHCLQAWGNLEETLENSGFARPFLLHSYGGPGEMIARFLERGAYFSLSGYFFLPEKWEKLERFDSIPLDRILLETDAPDMMPPDELIVFPLKDEGKEPINHPGNLVAIYEAFAERIGISRSELESHIRENFGQWRRIGGSDQEKSDSVMVRASESIE
jgi:TatD DNase family protein